MQWGKWESCACIELSILVVCMSHAIFILGQWFVGKYYAEFRWSFLRRILGSCVFAQDGKIICWQKFVYDVCTLEMNQLPFGVWGYFRIPHVISLNSLQLEGLAPTHVEDSAHAPVASLVTCWTEYSPETYSIFLLHWELSIIFNLHAQIIL